MLPGMEMMACQDLAVPAAVMRHVVHVESGANPYAIGVVGGRLQRQPRRLDEAVATARMLEAKGYNFSLGIAQVNRFNLDKYGLDTHEKAFDTCSNLSAAARILAGCYTSAGGNWGKAFSCYYSGNFVRGFEDGYVQKVYDSISRGRVVADNASMAIPLLPQTALPADSQAGSATQGRSARRTRDDRIAMRSVPLRPAAIPAPRPADQTTAPPVGQPANAQPQAAASEVFVPQVRGPGDPPGPLSALPQSAPTTTADQADLRRSASDSAFVF